jgi:hypothetical protein
LSGFFPDFFPAGKFDLDLVKGFRRKISVFFSVILNKKETHFYILTIQPNKQNLIKERLT